MDGSKSDVAAKAVREYMEVLDRYNKLIDKYFVVSEVEPGKELKTGEVLTAEALKEIDEVGAELEEKRKRWHKAMESR